MKQSKITIFLAILIALLFLFSGCSMQYIPSEGLWICEKLQIHVDFTSGECYVIEDGKRVECYFENDKGSKWICISCIEIEQNSIVNEEIILDAECVKCDEQELVVKEYQTEREYIFIRKDHDTD